MRNVRKSKDMGFFKLGYTLKMALLVGTVIFWSKTHILHLFISPSISFNMLPSGNLTVGYWTRPIEIVDLPIKNGDLYHRFLYVYQRLNAI